MTESVIDFDVRAGASLMDEMRGRIQTLDKRIGRADAAIEDLKAQIAYQTHCKAEMLRLRCEYSDAVSRLS